MVRTLTLQSPQYPCPLVSKSHHLIFLHKAIKLKKPLGFGRAGLPSPATTACHWANVVCRRRANAFMNLNQGFYANKGALNHPNVLNPLP